MKESKIALSMFENTNRITFRVLVDHADANWWRSEFYEPHRLTPEDIGDRLSASWSGEKRMVVTELDGVHQRFSIEVTGKFDPVKFWLHDRTLDLGGKVLNANRMFVSEDMRQLGTGRAFMNEQPRSAIPLQYAGCGSKLRTSADTPGSDVASSRMLDPG